MTFDAARKEIKRNSQLNFIEFYFSFELLCDAHHILNVRTGCYLLLLSMWGERRSTKASGGTFPHD